MKASTKKCWCVPADQNASFQYKAAPLTALQKDEVRTSALVDGVAVAVRSAATELHDFVRRSHLGDDLSGGRAGLDAVDHLVIQGFVESRAAEEAGLQR